MCCFLQIPVLPDPSTPEPAALYLPDFPDHPITMAGSTHIENNNFTQEQNESPNKESSMAISQSINSQVNSQTNSQANSQTKSQWFGKLANGKSEKGKNNRPDFNLPIKKNNPFSPVSDTSTTSSNGLNAVNNNNGDTSDWSSGSSSGGRREVCSQDATGNHVTPRLEPPPKVNKRHSRISVTSPSNLDVLSPDSNGNSRGSLSSTTSSNSLDARSGDKRLKTFKPVELKELNTLPKPNKDMKKNKQNLTHNVNLNGKIPVISQASSDSTTKLRLSFSDEENTENSEDSGVAQSEAKRLDAMTFDEFEALAS